jgi:hypothetical protein
MIVSPWLPIASILTEILAHAKDLPLKKITENLGSEGLKHIAERWKKDPRIVAPSFLLELKMHLSELKEATDALAKETHGGPLSRCYAERRADWFELYTPTHTVLHNLDPIKPAALGVYSKRLSELLKRELVVSESRLADALRAERKEIDYDTDSHLCTLCLFVVTEWSISQTMVRALNELSVALADTIELLDGCIRSTWSLNELTT